MSNPRKRHVSKRKSRPKWARELVPNPKIERECKADEWFEEEADDEDQTPEVPGTDADDD